MKSLYYRPQKISSRSLVAIAVVSIATLATVELYQQPIGESDHALMVSAANRADAAYRTIHGYRVDAGHRMLSGQDPAETGMIGPSMSLVTSLPGHLDSKQTSANPNFAAVVVQFLSDAGAQSGDEVAIGCTGSFPALNIAVLSAAETMGLKPTLVSSVASSQFGANHPELTWPEMERLLVEERIIATRSRAVSRGGFRDMAAGMTEDTRAVLDAAIARSEVPPLRCENLKDSIDRRIKIYGDDSGNLGRYVAYVNIGGGSASVGGTAGNDQLGRGLISPTQYRRMADPIDSVASRFLASGVSVINMIDVVAMAEQYGLPVAPSQRPTVGQGDVYQTRKYRKPLASGGIVIILMLTTFVVRPPRWLSGSLSKLGWRCCQADEPRWMV